MLWPILWTQKAEGSKQKATAMDTKAKTVADYRFFFRYYLRCNSFLLSAFGFMRYCY